MKHEQMEIQQMELDSRLKAFLASRRFYVCPEVRYRAVVRDLPETAVNSPVRVAFSKKGHLVEYPFTLKDTNQEKFSNQAAIKAVRFFFPGCRVPKIRKSIIFNAATEPVKVEFTIPYPKLTHSLYVKKPSSSRLIGKYLYNLLSGFDFKFGFNEDCFLEMGIGATMVSDLNEREYLRSRQYKINLARALAVADFIGAYGDILNSDNRLVNNNLETILFDFDQMLFDESIAPYHENKVVRQYSLGANYLQEAYDEELHDIVCRVAQNERNFFKIVALLGKLKVDKRYPIIDHDSDIKKRTKYRSLVDLFEHRVEQYRSR